MQTDETHAAIKNAASYLLTLCAKLYADQELLAAVQEEHRAYRNA